MDLSPSRALRRLALRLRAPLGRGARIPFLYHPDYRSEQAGIPMDAMRAERILTFLLDEGFVRSRDLVAPLPASLENLQRVHSPEYLRSLDDPEVVSQVLGLELRPEDARRAVELQRLIAGGTIQTTRLAVRRRGPAVHLGGGLHHAGPERGTGFCLLNDVAVAVRRLRARGFGEPVLVVDLDLHDGNGTRAAFADDPTVHTLSLHNERWDEVEAVADTAVEVGAGVEDDAYLDALRRVLPPVVNDHRPGLVVYIAGADPAASDEYGDGRLTGQGLLERDRFVVDTLRRYRRRLPLAVTLGGGYGPAAWRPSARFLGWLVAGVEVEPRDELAVALGRQRWMKRLEGEAGSEKDGGAGEEPLFRFDPSDLGAVGGGRGTEDRLLLGRFTRAEVEADLKRFGILDQLRSRGYLSPRVEILPSSGLGPTVRVHSGDGPAAPLLIELRVELDRATRPGLTLLTVQWLLLQDPRAEFSEARPPLPGQEHPGLGILADVVAWLVTLCRRMELDGLSFRSSHYYIAALAKRHMSFLHPADGARFAAIAHAAEGLTLAEASRAVEEGRVTDPATGAPVRWVDVPMVVPLSERLRASLATRPAAPPPTYRIHSGDLS